MTRPHWAILALFAALPLGCESSGHFTFLGYTSRPNYNENIRTVYVPQFQSQVFADSTSRTLPVDLTKAVIREIESKTPYKVVSDRSQADTELAGVLIMLNKALLNRNQLNEIREAEMVLTAAIVWKDLRTGEILSLPRRTPTDLVTPGIPALDVPEAGGYVPSPGPVLPPGALPPGPVPPVIVTGAGSYIPELGQSNITAYQRAIDRLATQIVSQMEKPW